MSFKRIKIIASIGLMWLVVGSSMLSCKKSAGTHNAEQIDSAPEMNAEEVPDPVENSDSLKVYYSKDLKSLGIKGDVISRSAMRNDAQMVYPIPTNELTFDENGELTGSLEGLYPKENEDGIIYSYSMNYEDGTSWELTYTEYNEEGYPVRAEIIESGPQGTAQAVITYYGYEYDRCGNWVMRSVTCDRSFTDMDTKEKTNTFRKWKELVSYKYREKSEPET